MTKFKMSDNINPYTAGITLEEALSGARALCAANVPAGVDDTTEVDEPPMTAEEMAIAMAGYAPRNSSSSAPPVVARSVFNLRRPVFRRHGNKKMPAAEHGPGGLSADDDATSPSSMSVGLAVAESFGAGIDNNHANDIGRDINHSGSLVISASANAFVSSCVEHGASPGYFPDDYPYELQNNDSALGGPITAPNGRQHVNYPVGNANLSGYFDSNGAFVANPVPARFLTDYLSPYTRGSIRFFGATGYSHGRGQNVGELDPGRMTPISATSSYAEHDSDNIDVNGGYEDPVNSIYPEPPTDEQCYGGHSFTTQGPFANTVSSSFGDYNGYQQVTSEQYTDPNQYLAHLPPMAPKQYTAAHNNISRNQGFDSFQNMASNPQAVKSTAKNAKAKRKPYAKRVDNKEYQKGPKKSYGTLYNENGKLHFPIQHYREYMNGVREMNGHFAESTLAPVPCYACAVGGLTCSVLSRGGDHGKVFTRMRRPWHNQEVSNYIVCGNCWNQMGSPQTCSFWRRPKGKEIPPLRHSR
jgi:hypothetical protein